MDTWVLPAMLGLGLAAASGMRTFLPLLMLSAAVHFELFGITVGESMRWIGSTGALVASSGNFALAIGLLASLLVLALPVIAIDRSGRGAARIVRRERGIRAGARRQARHALSRP